MNRGLRDANLEDEKRPDEMAECSGEQDCFTLDCKLLASDYNSAKTTSRCIPPFKSLPQSNDYSFANQRNKPRKEYTRSALVVEP